jgi:hypothetical protein
MRALALAPFAALLAGCGLTEVDGITVYQDRYDDSRAQIMARAESELGCPRAELTTRMLTVTVHADVRRMNVKGCGKDVIYARTDDGFAIETSPPPPER